MDASTKETVKKLTSYLPRFKTEPYLAEGYGFYQSYADYVDEFFALIEKDFSNRDYAKQGMAELDKLLKDDKYIATATLDQLKDLLTLCSRGERLCSGYRADCIEKNRIELIINRLNLLCLEN